MDIPATLKYSRTHEWVRVEGDIATVGITDHAQAELGDVVYVELPEVGRIVSAGDVFGTVESVKAVSDLYSPVSGEVVEANLSLPDATEAVNQDPYGAGWMVRIRMANPTEVNQLLTADEYRKTIEEE
ncbi:MAG: glycine cleavage system protein GcvH [Chthonomonadales bacterium]